MRLPKLTLTQNKVISVCGWSAVVLMQTIALRSPIAGMPPAAKALAAAVLFAAAVAVIVTAFGLRTEKPDERAASNQYRANSSLFMLIFFLFGFYILFGDRFGWETLTFTRGQIIQCFGLLCLLQDGLFLLYERFGN